MSVRIGRSLRRALAVAGVALAASLFLTAPAPAQAPRGSDLLEQYRERSAVAAQQLENDIHDAVAEAQRLAASDPDKALGRLQKALARLDADTVLAPDRRNSLIRDLKERIRVAQADSRRAARDRAEATDRGVRAAARRAEADRDTAETEQIKQQLRNIRALQEEGRSTEASRLAEDVARRYPTNLAAQVAARTTGMADRVNGARQMQAESERRRLLVYQDVDRSALLPIGDIEFPKDWAEKTKMRKARMNPMTAKERAILESLNKPLTLEVKDAKLYEVLDELQKRMGQTFNVDEGALQQAMVSEDTPVSVRARRPMAARTVLRRVLEPLGLSYVVKDETILITTKEQARQMMTVRTYYIGDLLGTMDLTLPPALNQLQMANNVAYIIDLIQRTVDPESWAANGRGGQAAIAFDPVTMSLIVKQSAEVHLMMGGGTPR